MKEESWLAFLARNVWLDVAYVLFVVAIMVFAPDDLWPARVVGFSVLAAAVVNVFCSGFNAHARMLREADGGADVSSAA